MSTRFNPTLLTDCYKFGHRQQYPEGTTRVYSNLTPRGSRIPGIDSVVFFGFQAFLVDLMRVWNKNFFYQNKEDVVAEYQKVVGEMIGEANADAAHIEALHDLGYLPLRFRALPEGSLVPLRVPVFTVENTHPDFFWLVNYIETYASAETWHRMTSATLAYRMRTLLDEYAAKTSSTPEFVDFQAHDFSMRGMTSVESAAASGAGHLTCFAGTDTVPAISWIRDHYVTSDAGLIGGSVPATEHSVMCAGGELDEDETFRRLLDLYPSGIVSVVSDTWDLWNVLTKILPKLKYDIMDRDGKLVIRPDSGDPVNILCGDPNAGIRQPAYKGVIELLWDEFGGTVNDKGYKELDPHVGAIYGDSITYERAEEICRRLEEKGFASTNVVFGVGSFSYQYVTRDTFGFAMKATWAEVDGEGRDLFKDPVTDSGLKKSATGRLAVVEMAGKPVLMEKADPRIEESHENMLEVVWENGFFQRTYPWTEILDNVGKRVIR